MRVVDYVTGRRAGVPRARAAKVASAAGAVYTVTRMLGSTSTIALLTAAQAALRGISQGTDANLSLGGVQITAAAAIAPAATQYAVVEERAANGQASEAYVVALTGQGLALAQITLGASVTQAEGNSGTTVFQFTVTRTRTSDAASAAWAVTGTGANPNTADDFVGGVLPSGTVSFAIGEASKTISVPVQGDTVVEPDETFLVTLSAPSAGYAIAGATATGTVTNDDVAAASALVPTNWDFIGYGDSRTENGLGGAGTAQHGYAAWIGPCTGGRLRPCSNDNYGISVSKISQGAKVPRQDYTGTVTAASTAKGADKAALENAGIVVFRYGTNDTEAELTSTDMADTLTILNNLRSNQLKILVTENACGWNILGQVANARSSAGLKSFRDWMLTLDYASGHANARSDVIVVDYWPIVYDAVNDRNKQGYLRDGKHDSVWGALQFGNALHARLTAAYGATYTNMPVNASLPVTNGASIAADTVGPHAPYVHTNPTMIPGTNGQVLGTNWRTAPLASQVPQGWIVQSQGTGAAIDIVFDKTSEVDPDGYPVLKMTFSGTLADQNGFQLQLIQNAQATGRAIALTDKLRTVMRRKIDLGSKGLNGARTTMALLNSADATQNRSVGIMSWSTGGTNDRIGYDISTPAQLAGQGLDFDAGRGNWEWLISGVLDVNGMTAITTQTLSCFVSLANYTGASLDISAVVRIARFGVYKEP